MWRAVASGLVAGAVVVGGVWGWRSPTVTLLRLKLALDRHDLAGVESALDFNALTEAALSGLLEEHAAEPETVRLALRGKGGWLPSMASARDYLRIRLQRTVERMVEEPTGMLRVSWVDLRRALGTLRRDGAVAFFVYREGDDGPDYAVRLRSTSGRWRIVSVERDGTQALLRAAPAHGASEPEPVAATHASSDDAASGEERFTMGVDEAELLANTVPAPRHRTQQPFARRLDDGSWTVQVASTTDAWEAEAEREWFSRQKERVFLMPGTVHGTTWQRVMVGRYPTCADATREAERLSTLGAKER